ncbi:MAG: hypothetical protein KVP17_000156 [Porospora cf. gigantea B]|uniref:uncharacterized protein n=1 Tax=Porospora cf. gigantea B TaxID=2853592 RepID=UPI0035717C4F|nr:MAG: hypothetical protein KVP17_000156 [Porospora cf. gigantea B]
MGSVDPLTIAGGVALAMASALFSGLTLGLMTLDVVGLQILIDSKTDVDEGSAAEEGRTRCKHAGSQKEAQYARRILKVRKDGNLLLVTLLVGNVAVNSAFSILMGAALSGITGFLISTVVITVFGEIIPQAVCSRYALIVGYYTMPVVVFIEICLYIICKPIALVLDWILGEDLGTIYSKKQLEALVGHHQKELNVLGRAEAQILKGGLKFSSLTAVEAMTPLRRVFGVDARGVYDTQTAAKLIQRGFSRVPVLDMTNEEEPISGVLYVKDLLLVNPAEDVPITRIMKSFPRNVLVVDPDSRLDNLLSEFKKGTSHFAVVRDVVDDGERDPHYKHIGIITMEDIVEEIIQDEIWDEFDESAGSSLSLVADASKRRRASVCHVDMLGTQPETADRNIHTILAMQPGALSALDRKTVAALAAFLSRMHTFFAPSAISLESLEELIATSEVVSSPSRLTVHKHQPLAGALVVLEGQLLVTSGYDNFQTVSGALSLVGSAALMEAQPLADFSHFAKGKCACVFLDAEHYHDLCRSM